MKTTLRHGSGQPKATEDAREQRPTAPRNQRPHENDLTKKKKGRAELSRGPPIQEVCRRYCGFVVSAGLSPPPTFFISCPVSSAPFLTTLPVFLATFSVPFAVSLATTLVAWPVSSAAFSVPFAVSFAATLVAWPVAFAAFSVAAPVLSAAFSVPFAVSFAATLVACPVSSAPFFTSVAAS